MLFCHPLAGVRWAALVSALLSFLGCSDCSQVASATRARARYQISLSSRGFEKKTSEEKAIYRAKKEKQKQTRESGAAYEYLPRGKPHAKTVGRVCIHADRFAELRAEALGLAVHRNACYLRHWFFNQPFLPYAPVRWQLKTLLREVNKARRHAFGPTFEPVPDDAIRFYMKHVPAFRVVNEMPNEQSNEAA